MLRRRDPIADTVTGHFVLDWTSEIAGRPFNGFTGIWHLEGTLTLESVFAICLGCMIFAVLMRAGIVSEAICERCNNIWANDNPAHRAAS